VRASLLSLTRSRWERVVVIWAINCSYAAHMIYFHCKGAKLPPIRKLVKGKSYLERLLKDKPHPIKGNREAIQTVNRS